MTTESWFANTLAKSSAAPLDGTETVRLVKAGSSKRGIISDIKDYIVGLANTWIGAQIFAGGVELRNAAIAQIFRVYDAYTDASNYRRLAFFSNPYALRVMTEESGTYAGAPKRLEVGTSGAAPFYIYTSNTARWQVDGNGHVLASTDAAYDLGATNSSRPRNIYAAGTISAGTISAGANITAATQFYTPGFMTIGDSIAAPVAVAGRANIYVDNADGSLKVKFGNGTVKTIATNP